MNERPRIVIQPHEQIILFDGVCKLCNGWSRFIIRFDKRRLFRLCTVQSPAGQDILQKFGYPVDRFDTMLLVQNGRPIEKSDAFFAVVSQLPTPWPFLKVFQILPRQFRDGCYDHIAQNRYTLFGQYDNCILAEPDYPERFL